MFFTPTLLCSRMSQLLPEVKEPGLVCDPRCSAGDLLLSAAKQLPV